MLARILQAADFGLMAIAMAFLLIVSSFADFGLSRAIIHYGEIPSRTLSSLFWLNTALGACLTVVLMIAAVPLAHLYNKPELANVLLAVSPIFLLSSAGQQFRVLAEKELRFKRLAIVETVAAATGTLIAVTIAFSGGGVYALVGGAVGAASAGLVLSWWKLSDGYRPAMLLHVGAAIPFLRYGFYIVAEGLVNTLNRQADVFIGGLTGNVSALGTYSLPRDLSLRIGTVINPIITRIGFPVMARLQSDAHSLRLVYLQMLRMTASVNAPIYVAIGIFAPEVVALLYGSGWTGAISFLQVFAAWGIVRSTGNPVGSLLFAVGKARLALWWNVVLLFVMGGVLLPSAKFGGLQSLAWALLIVHVFLFALSWFFLVRPACGARFRDYLAAVAVPLLLALAGGAAAWIGTRGVPHGTLRLALGGCIGGATYLALSFAFNRIWAVAIFELLRPNRLR
jgi:O-antigen/teichoic acid export membrane protein